MLGVSIAYFASCLLMRTTIMTEKLARRGVSRRASTTSIRSPTSSVAGSRRAKLHALPLEQSVAEALAEVGRQG